MMKELHSLENNIFKRSREGEGANQFCLNLFVAVFLLLHKHHF